MKTFLFCLAVSILSTSANLRADEIFTLPDASPEFGTFRKSKTLVSSYGELVNCRGLQDRYDASDWPKGATVETVRAVDARVKSRMVYRRDGDSDIWMSLAGPMIETSDRFYGDCEDMAITTAVLAICAGVPQERVGLAITDLRNARLNKHMVAIYRGQRDQVIVFGDTNGGPRPMSKARMDPIYWTYFPGIETWWVFRDRATGHPLVATQEIGPVTAQR